MKVLPTLLSCLLTTPALAQTGSAATHRNAAANTAAVSHRPAGACMVVPPMSPSIPALPTGAPCPKPLYTVTTVPAIKLADVSPMEGSSLAETLGIESSTFTLGYVDTRVGAGELAPPHKWYTIEYTGYLLDGTKFDSSVGRAPISIPYGDHRVILGWDTGFAGMHVGGKRRLFIPYQLAYGAQGRDKIPPRAELIFDVELLKVSDSDPTPHPAPSPAAAPAKAPESTRPATAPATTTPAAGTNPAQNGNPSTTPTTPPPNNVNTPKPQP